MPVPRRRPPARLRVERLEARLTPAAFDPSRVLVTTTGPSLDAPWTAVLRTSPAVADVVKVGDHLFRTDLAPGATVATAVADLAGRDGVAAAQPDYRLTADAAVTPNDPNVAAGWQYGVTNAAAAWGVSTGTGRTVVAVIDTGVFVNHPDLTPNIWRNPGEVADNGKDDDGDGYVDDTIGWNFADNNNDVSDVGGHGTHAAGILGAVGGNGVGGAGVDWHARIMPLRFMSGSAGGLTSDAVRAIDYAVAHGANVINASWGGGPSDPALAAAVQRARAAGVIVVTAAGNYGTDTDASPFYPAGYSVQADNVVSVAASTPDDQLAAFSNYGKASVTLAAPGQWITSTAAGGGYVEKSGTSMAAPFVAGAISLLWDAHPDWNYRQILDKLKASVTTLPAFAGKVVAGGRIDLGRLLAAPAVPPVTATAAVAEAVIGGPRTGSVDRAWVRFTAAVDPATLSAAVTLSTPLGTVGPSAVLPVAGTGNTQFTLVFSKTYTAAGTYTLAVGPPAAAARYTQALTLGGTPVVSPPPAPVSPPPTPTPAAGRQTVTAAGLTAVRPGRTTRVELAVSTAATVRDVAVQLAVQHGRVSDLSIRLTSPDGRRATLFNRRGGAGADLAGTLFSDAAGASLAAAAAPFAGAVRPEQPLATLDGASARGVWVLEVFDLGATVSGTLSGVTLSFITAATQSVAWAATPPTPVASPEPTVAPKSPTTRVVEDVARPDAVVGPPPSKPTPPRPADITGWLVTRLGTRL